MTTMDDLKTMQIMVYVAVGGGMLGRLYAERPKHAYIDSRVGRLPYPRRKIEKMRLELIEMAEELNLDPANLPATRLSGL
jgi:hypothetical protein